MTARIIDRPQPGFFKLRRVRGGPWVPASIRRICACTIGGSVEHDHTDACDRSGVLVAEIGGREAEPNHVWMYGRPLEKAEHDEMNNAPDDRPLNEQPAIF